MLDLVAGKGKWRMNSMSCHFDRGEAEWRNLFLNRPLDRLEVTGWGCAGGDRTLLETGLIDPSTRLGLAGGDKVEAALAMTGRGR